MRAVVTAPADRESTIKNLPVASFPAYGIGKGFPMAFRDKLRVSIEQHGGLGHENLTKIVELARKANPDFSLVYLRVLLRGLPPRPDDIQALAVAIGIHPKDLLDDVSAAQLPQPEDAKRLMSERLSRPDLAENFADYVASEVKFRHKAITFEDLYVIARNFLLET